MDLVMLLAFMVLFIAVALAIVIGAQMLPVWRSGLAISSAPDAPQVRLELKEKASSRLADLGAHFAARFGRFLPSSLQMRRWQDSSLQRKFAQAGIRSDRAASLFLGAMIACALLGLAGGALLAISMGGGMQAGRVMGLAMLGLLAGLLLPRLALEIVIRRRQRQLLEHFPDALDLIRICLEAGLGLDAAIQRVGQEFRQTAPALFDEFHVLSLELRAGAGRTQALQNLAQRTGLAEIRSWTAMIVQSEKFGTGIAEAVRIHSDQLRMTRRLNAEQRAATLSTKLLFPLIFCIFPALLLVLLGPAVITIQQQLGTSVERGN